MIEYGVKFILDGTTDITSEVVSFSILCDLENYCRELSFELADEELFDSFDFSTIPESPRVEVFTRTTPLDEYYEDENDPAWISQGMFFIERPTFRVGLNATTTGIWGRQSTAILGEPFAQKVTKTWTENTTFYTICQEIVESVGLTWDDTRCDIQDFNIYSDNFGADDQYPIEALKSLVELIVGAEGYVTSDRFGNVWIKRLVRAPLTEDYNITDQTVQTTNEEPVWPEFGNRIKIIPTPSVSQDTINLYMDNQCIGEGSALCIDVYAQVKNGEGVPLNDSVVTWSFGDIDLPEDIWYKYPEMSKTSVQNSAVMLISNERKRATGFNSIELAFEPSSIIGIWAYADKLRTTNFAPEGGYVIDSNNVYLTDKSFDYCDQMVFVSYYASGMVKNSVVYDTNKPEPDGAVPVMGSLNVIVSVSGREDVKELYVNNSCKCKSSLSVKVDPTTITVGEGNAKIEAYLENSGYPVSGTIRMIEMSGFGTLSWSNRATSTEGTSEKTESVNAVMGQSQCVVSSVISSVTGVWVVEEDSITGLDTKIGNNLYSSFFGRTIDLNAYVITGTNLLVEYSRAGAVVNYLTGVAAGVSRIDVSADVSSEEGLVQTVQVNIQPPPSPYTPSPYTPSPYTPSPYTPPPPPPPPATYFVSGPGSIIYQPYITPGGILNIYSTTYTYETFGPWYLKKNVGGVISTVLATLSVNGTGYLQVSDGNKITTKYETPSQTFTINLYGLEGGQASMQVTYTRAEYLHQ